MRNVDNVTFYCAGYFKQREQISLHLLSYLPQLAVIFCSVLNIYRNVNIRLCESDSTKF